MSDWQRQMATSGGGRMPPPPFFADAVKFSAMDHVESVRRLRNCMHHAPPESEVAADLSSGNAGISVDATTELRVVHSLLITDLYRLLEGIQFLDLWLRDDRDMIWLLNVTLAVCCDLVLGNASVRSFVKDFVYLALLDAVRCLAYLVAMFRIAKMERQILSTAAGREELMGLVRRVRNGDVLEDQHLRCLAVNQRDFIPWSRFE